MSKYQVKGKLLMWPWSKDAVEEKAKEEAEDQQPKEKRFQLMIQFKDGVRWSWQSAKTVEELGVEDKSGEDVFKDFIEWYDNPEDKTPFTFQHGKAESLHIMCFPRSEIAYYFIKVVSV